MNEFNIFNEIERSQWNIDKNNKKLNLVDKDRINLDIELIGNNVFENKNNLINSLQDEIDVMKNKMKFYYEKEQEIMKLKNIIVKQVDEIKKVDSLKRIIVNLKRQNMEYEKQFERMLSDIKSFDRLIHENKQLRIELEKHKPKKKDKFDLSKLYSVKTTSYELPTELTIQEIDEESSDDSDNDSGSDSDS